VFDLCDFPGGGGVIIQVLDKLNTSVKSMLRQQWDQ
jgi:hypothetical protein